MVKWSMELLDTCSHFPYNRDGQQNVRGSATGTSFGGPPFRSPHRLRLLIVSVEIAPQQRKKKEGTTSRSAYQPDNYSLAVVLDLFLAMAFDGWNQNKWTVLKERKVPIPKIQIMTMGKIIAAEDVAFLAEMAPNLIWNLIVGNEVRDNDLESMHTQVCQLKL